MGMAEGGLTDIPVPPSMFDEQEDTESFGGGGLVAFADGGALADGYNIPSTGYPELDALIPGLIQQESRYNPNARNTRSGAAGLMQLMPGTARDMGVTDVYNPQQNLAGGVGYLKQQYEKYHDIPTALAAYNWGPGHVDAWLASGANPAKLPNETKAYINAIAGPNAVPKPAGGASSLDSNVGFSRVPQGDINDAFDRIQQMIGPAPDYKELNAWLSDTPNRVAKEKKDDLWSTLAQIGFGMAGSKSPYFLQALGEAGTAAMPAMREASTARDKEARDAIMEAAQLQGQQYGYKTEQAKAAAELYKTAAGTSQADQSYRLGEREADIKEQLGMVEAAVSRANAQDMSGAKDYALKSWMDTAVPSIAQEPAFKGASADKIRLEAYTRYLKLLHPGVNAAGLDLGAMLGMGGGEAGTPAPAAAARPPLNSFG
jgi:hypothetical protein